MLHSLIVLFLPPPVICWHFNTTTEGLAKLSTILHPMLINFPLGVETWELYQPLNALELHPSRALVFRLISAVHVHETGSTLDLHLTDTSR
ncbi:hypothetical protein BDW22DRAFT_740188 [Trametopsis cervina]|nr:hypothetical protein BDW22DRAFT_740188 [Trametopsis cervina]